MSLTITRKVSVTGGTVLRAANNLGDVADMPTTQANLGIPQGRNALAPRNGLVFDGTAPAAGTLSAIGAGGYTVALNFNLKSLATDQGIFDSSGFIFVVVRTSGALEVYDRIGASYILATAAGTVTAGITYELTLVRGAAYLNGNSISTYTDTSTYTGTTYKLGSDFNGTTLTTGTIRLLGIANRAMSASEVLALYQTKTWPKSDYGTYLLCAPEANPPGNGNQWHDMSGNGAHIVLPTSGVAWALPSAAVNKLRGTTSTSGNQQLLGATTLLANTQITRIRARSRSGTPSITLGTASGGSQIVASVALSTAWKDLTIALTGGIISTNSSVWVGSSTADVVEIDITHEPLGY